MNVLLASQLCPPMPPSAPGSLNVSISFRCASVLTMLSEAVLNWATLDSRESLNVHSSSLTCNLVPPVKQTSIILLLCTMGSNGLF